MSQINMPTIGLGTWKSKPGEVTDAVKVAIDCGYRMIDCAYVYGNEKEVGEALKDAFSSEKVKREDMFIVSKLWNTRHNPNDVRPSLQESLSLLGLSYIDLYLIHWPQAYKPGKELFPADENGQIQFADINYVDTWKNRLGKDFRKMFDDGDNGEIFQAFTAKALEKCVDEGLAKHIGLSNFNSKQVQDVIDNSRIKPVNLQVEIHPYLTQEKLVEFAQKRGISVTAYSPFGSPDRVWALPDEPKILDNPVLKDIGTKHKKSPAQVILRWLLQRNIKVIPKSVTASRIKENIDIFDFTLSDEEMEAVSALNKDLRRVYNMTEKDGKYVRADVEAPHFPFSDSIEF